MERACVRIQYVFANRYTRFFRQLRSRHHTHCDEVSDPEYMQTYGLSSIQTVGILKEEFK